MLLPSNICSSLQPSEQHVKYNIPYPYDDGWPTRANMKEQIMKSLTKSATKTLLVSAAIATLFSASVMANEMENNKVSPVTSISQTQDVVAVDYSFSQDFNASFENQLNKIDAAITAQIDESIKMVNQQISAQLAKLFN